MVGINNQPQYEVQIFVGADTLTNTVYALCLDSFGTLYSVSQGTGKFSTTSIEFVIPYTMSPFRDIFTYSSEEGTWTLLIEYFSETTNVLKEFAAYEFKRERTIC